MADTGRGKYDHNDTLVISVICIVAIGFDSGGIQQREATELSAESEGRSRDLCESRRLQAYGRR